MSMISRVEFSQSRDENVWVRTREDLRALFDAYPEAAFTLDDVRESLRMVALCQQSRLLAGLDWLVNRGLVSHKLIDDEPYFVRATPPVPAEEEEHGFFVLSIGGPYG